jgi:hypothetical protein
MSVGDGKVSSDSNLVKQELADIGPLNPFALLLVLALLIGSCGFGAYLLFLRLVE